MNGHSNQQATEMLKDITCRLERIERLLVLVQTDQEWLVVKSKEWLKERADSGGATTERVTSQPSTGN